MLQGDAVSPVRDSVADRVEGALRVVDGHVLQHRRVPHKGVVPVFHLWQTEGKLRLWAATSGRRPVHLEMGQFQHNLLSKGSEIWELLPDTGAVKGLG